MTSVRQSHVTTMSSNHDNNLDALLEELQTSVSRPGSALGHNMNGHAGGVTGYREVTRTVTTETAGQPSAKTSEYQIEYLNPSNTTTVLQEISPSLLHDTTGRNASGVTSYKTVEYKYNTTGSHLQDAGAPVADLRMRQNITELDSLLDDLHTAQRTGFADSGVSRHTPGIDPGLLEPIESSTPKSSHVSRSVEKRTVQEQRYGSVGHGRTSPAREREVRKELVFTGGSNKRDQPSPSPIARKEIYHYESKTTRSGSANSRDLSPPQDRRQPSPSPARQVTTTVRTYNYPSDDVPRTPTMHRSPSPAGVRSSSNTTVRQYNYSKRDFSPEGVRQPPLRSPSPTTKVTTVRNYYNTPQEPPRNTSSKVTSVNSYSYNSSSRDTRTPQEVPRSPPPHRSPSPVSFIPPASPSTNKSTTVKSYNFDQSSNAPYVRPQSPQPVQKFSPSDPSRTLTYQVSPPPPQPQPTVITYKYSSQTTHSTKYPGEENVPLLPRPFPTPSPTPEQQQQQPPKKLDELMASFSDTDIQRHHESSTRYVPVKEPPVQRTEASAPAAPPTPPPPVGPSPASTAAAMQVKSKNIAGPPVYYPPGVELFAKKEEAMMQSQSGGGKYKAKSKYEYEASSKMKTKESSGKTVVPVCLPVCCAMPCVIM